MTITHRTPRLVRGIVALTAALLLFAAASSSAADDGTSADNDRRVASQQAAAVRVEGGRSPGTAPTLASGRYHDAILPADERWYRLDLAPGQVPKALLTPRELSADGLSPFAELQLELLSDDTVGDLRCRISALRELTDDQGGLNTEKRLRVVGEPMAAGAGLCREPGRYYLRLVLADRIEPAMEGVRLDFGLKVSLSSAEAVVEVPEQSGAVNDIAAGQRSGSSDPVRTPDLTPVWALLVVLGGGAAGLACGAALARQVSRWAP